MVITYDPTDVLRAFATRHGIMFPLLSDQGSEVIRRYGLLNTTVPSDNPTFGYPHPGTFILDRAGKVTARFFETLYQERNTLSSVLVRLGGRVEADAVRTTTPHMTITSYATDAVAAPGSRFSLVLDITPGPKMHVYAPGVAGYKPITLTVDPPAGVLLRGRHYPPAEEYYFEPLEERVQVYQRPFRVIQDVVIDASRGVRERLLTQGQVVITGRLDYQACDDRLCYMPQRIPLQWTVRIKPHDR